MGYTPNPWPNLIPNKVTSLDDYSQLGYFWNSIEKDAVDTNERKQLSQAAIDVQLKLVFSIGIQTIVHIF